MANYILYVDTNIQYGGYLRLCSINCNIEHEYEDCWSDAAFHFIQESIYKGEAYSKQKEGKKLVGDWMDAAPHLEQRNVSVLLFYFVYTVFIAHYFEYSLAL